MTDEGAVERLLASDPTLFVGPTAAHSLGWLRHPERYLDEWLNNVERLLPRRHERTLLLGMGGSSSPARLYADLRPDGPLTVLDTSNPDTIASVDFAECNVIASSKSGATIETMTLLEHALEQGLRVEDLVVVTDPGSSLEVLGYSLGATVFEGDPDTGGRFSGLSPFGLIPALYAGWTGEELRDELVRCTLSHELCVRAINHADSFAQRAADGEAFFALGADPITSGAALWLEQLIAETTGKEGRGFIPVLEGQVQDYRPGDMMYWHLVAALLARHIGVDPFNQPDVESAKKDVFVRLEHQVSWEPPQTDVADMRHHLAASTYNVLQVYSPLDVSPALAHLRARTEGAYGTTTANLGPRYLHSTGQLHKGGPAGICAVQIVQRPRTAAVRIASRPYTFHDLHMAQAQSDLAAMRDSRRRVWQLVVDDLDEAAYLLGLDT